ncbi:hypothetical protein CLF_107173 [Clonorchis sinensis]|uniref:Uncharacterized protein n=1 Tax=Clonorchis sinensis TaxID=79923 RepID=G7YQH2_CLOSI|nr:hypothetical protein CLF_107173 [Clonorchis sinensis]
MFTIDCPYFRVVTLTQKVTCCRMFGQKRYPMQLGNERVLRLNDFLWLQSSKVPLRFSNVAVNNVDDDEHHQLSIVLNSVYIRPCFKRRTSLSIRKLQDPVCLWQTRHFGSFLFCGHLDQWSKLGESEVYGQLWSSLSSENFFNRSRNLDVRENILTGFIRVDAVRGYAEQLIRTSIGYNHMSRNAKISLSILKALYVNFRGRVKCHTPHRRNHWPTWLIDGVCKSKICIAIQIFVESERSVRCSKNCITDSSRDTFYGDITAVSYTTKNSDMVIVAEEFSSSDIDVIIQCTP